MKKSLFSLILLLTLLTVTASAQEVGTYEVIECTYPTPAFFEAECGTFTVPENRDDPDGRTLQLAVLTVFAGDEDADPDAAPLFFVPGGPGGSVLSTVAAAFPTQFAPLARTQNMIFMDPRGTGLSEPRLYCTEITNGFIELLAFTGTAEEEADLQRSQIDACRERLAADGIDFSAYTTDEIAADYNELRQALGYDRWSIMGTSYGSRVALEIMRDYPDNITSAILDSVYPPQVDLFATTIDNIERALDEVFTECASTERCAEAFPDLRGMFDGLYTSLNEEPASIPVQAGPAGNFDLIIDGDRVYDWAFNWLYETENVALLPQRLYALALGNYAAPAQSGAEAESRVTRLDMGAYYAIQCNDEAAFSSPDSIAGQLERFPQREAYLTSSAALGESLFALCEPWQTGAPDADINEPVTSDIPTLIFTGRYDPVTPPAWAELAAETLSDHYLFEIGNVAHGVTRSSSCAMLVARNFLLDPTTNPEHRCIPTEVNLRFPVGVR